MFSEFCRRRAVFPALSLILATASCSVKEDREDCPCALYIHLEHLPSRPVKVIVESERGKEEHLAYGDTVVLAPVDSALVAKTETSAEVAETPAEVAEKPAAVVEKPQEQPKAEEQPVVDKYAEKDARVRLGAYRIVGLDQEVKVQAGQTFRSICKAYLGPDMECYVEVFNNLPKNPTVKAGQVIKIPKLQVKKKRQQTAKK